MNSTTFFISGLNEWNKCFLILCHLGQPKGLFLVYFYNKMGAIATLDVIKLYKIDTFLINSTANTLIDVRNGWFLQIVIKAHVIFKVFFS